MYNLSTKDTQTSLHDSNMHFTLLFTYKANAMTFYLENIIFKVWLFFGGAKKGKRTKRYINLLEILKRPSLFT